MLDAEAIVLRNTDCLRSDSRSPGVANAQATLGDSHNLHSILLPPRLAAGQNGHRLSKAAVIVCKTLLDVSRFDGLRVIVSNAERRYARDKQRDNQKYGQSSQNLISIHWWSL